MVVFAGFVGRSEGGRDWGLGIGDCGLVAVL